MDYSPPGSSVLEIFQARILEWVANSFSMGSSQPRDKTQVSFTGRQILYHWATWEAAKKQRGPHLEDSSRIPHQGSPSLIKIYFIRETGIRLEAMGQKTLSSLEGKRKPRNLSCTIKSVKRNRSIWPRVPDSPERVNPYEDACTCTMGSGRT